MNNELKVFENDEFGAIRTIEVNDKMLFCGKDVASALGYSITSKAINTHCKGVSKMEVPTNGGVQQMLFITEGDVYRLIAHSKLPNAQKFESWVFDDVLPSIRKNGAYMTGDTIEKALENPDFLIQLATKLKAEKEKNAKLIEENERMKPKEIFADSVMTSKSCILISELAKILKQNGIEMGARRLFAWLREKGFLIKRKGSEYNLPTQRSMELGLFEIKETSISHSDGHVTISKTPKVTGKSQVYFINVFKTKVVIG